MRMRVRVWKLRCLLVLIDACLEKVEGMGFLGLGFEGLRYYDVLLRLGGVVWVAAKFSQELADNTTFAELGDPLVKEWLGRLPRYFLAPKAVGFGDCRLVSLSLVFYGPGRCRG